jgi:hypothetical protein
MDDEVVGVAVVGVGTDQRYPREGWNVDKENAVLNDSSRRWALVV